MPDPGDCSLPMPECTEPRGGRYIITRIPMTLDVTHIQALCFDVDGTLSDTDDQFVQRLTRMLRPASFLFPRRDPRPFARQLVMATESPGNYLLGLPDRLEFDHKLAALGDWIYRIGLGRGSSLFLLVPGVRDALIRLQPRYPMAIVSARGERSTRAFLDQFELAPFFQCIVTAQTCPHTKPYPDPIQFAAQQMGVSPQDCLMIGDTTVDICAGKAAGSQTLGVLCGFGEEGELRRAGADMILPSTSVLTDVLL